MPPRRKKVVAEDDENEMEMEEEDLSDKLYPELSDGAVDAELNLPSLLSSLAKRKKRELLEFKRSHNEVSFNLSAAFGDSSHDCPMTAP